MDEPLKNRNEDNEWSLMDRVDLIRAVEEGVPIMEIADFLMRREDEVVAKMAELGLTHPGEALQKREG